MQNEGTHTDTKALFYNALEPQHFQLYRLVRLRALSESPTHFTSTLQRELAFQPDAWIQRLSDPDQITLVATSSPSVDLLDFPPDIGIWNQPEQFKFSDHILYGMVKCIRFPDNPSDAFIVGFWVAPGLRGHGIGRALIERALKWAAQHNDENEMLKAVILDVLEDNLAARRVYERCGFKDEGKSLKVGDGIRYSYSLA